MTKTPDAQPRLCWEFHDLRTPWGPIKLEQHGPNNFRTTYGREVKDGLSYVAAGSSLGLALLHFLSCEGRVDNRTEAEARKDSYFDYTPPPSAPVERTPDELEAALAAWQVASGADAINAARDQFKALWPSLELRPNHRSTLLWLETSPGVGAILFHLTEHRQRTRSPELVALACKALNALARA